MSYIFVPIVLLSVWISIPVHAQTPSNGVVRLSSFPSYGKDSPFHLAKEAGFYKSERVEFEFQATFAGALPPVVVGHAEVAQELCSEIVSAIVRGAPLKIIAAREAKFPVATISLKSGGINGPADYAGKRWATSVGANPELSVMRDLARINGFSADSVKIVNVPFNARAAALLSGQVDFASAWYGSGLVQLGSILTAAGVPFTFVRWSEYGIDIHGQCLAARIEWLQANSALTSSFLKATLRGFTEALSNPDRAVEATVKRNAHAGLDARLIAQQWAQARELLVDDYSSVNGLLSVDPDKIIKIAEMIMPGLAVDTGKLFTNEYLSGL